MEFDSGLLGRIDAATVRLLRTVSTLDDAGVGSRPEAPAVRLTTVDTGANYAIGAPTDADAVRGTQAALLAWLLGRSDGAGLDGPLPEVPFLY